MLVSRRYRERVTLEERRSGRVRAHAWPTLVCSDPSTKGRFYSQPLEELAPPPIAMYDTQRVGR